MCFGAPTVKVKATFTDDKLKVIYSISLVIVDILLLNFVLSILEDFQLDCVGVPGVNVTVTKHKNYNIFNIFSYSWHDVTKLSL